MAEYVAGFCSPELRANGATTSTRWSLTVQIALWGTFLAVVAAVPFGHALGSNNMAPWCVVQPVRRLMDALPRRSTSWSSRCCSSSPSGWARLPASWRSSSTPPASSRSCSRKPSRRSIRGRSRRIRATGATRLQEVVYGVVPQVLPLWMSYALYRFESNVRAATVLGVIGAGGIGQVLFEVDPRLLLSGDRGDADHHAGHRVADRPLSQQLREHFL